jgi:hypothetical protein
MQHYVKVAAIALVAVAIAARIPAVSMIVFGR